MTAYRAGHVLGAAMFMVEIAGLRVLYTGDYSRLADRHLSAADLPELKPDVGVQSCDRACVPLLQRSGQFQVWDAAHALASPKVHSVMSCLSCCQLGLDRRQKLEVQCDTNVDASQQLGTPCRSSPPDSTAQVSQRVHPAYMTAHSDVKVSQQRNY